MDFITDTSSTKKKVRVSFTKKQLKQHEIQSEKQFLKQQEKILKQEMKKKKEYDEIPESEEGKADSQSLRMRFING
jgi:hypothetical protein